MGCDLTFRPSAPFPANVQHRFTKNKHLVATEKSMSPNGKCFVEKSPKGVKSPPLHLSVLVGKYSLLLASGLVAE